MNLPNSVCDNVEAMIGKVVILCRFTYNCRQRSAAWRSGDFVSDYFLANIQFIAKNKSVFLTNLAILPNRCCILVILLLK